MENHTRLVLHLGNLGHLLAVLGHLLTIHRPLRSSTTLGVRALLAGHLIAALLASPVVPRHLTALLPSVLLAAALSAHHAATLFAAIGKLIATVRALTILRSQSFLHIFQNQIGLLLGKTPGFNITFQLSLQVNVNHLARIRRYTSDCDNASCA